MINNLKDFGSNIQADENIKNGTAFIVEEGFKKNTTIKSGEFNTYIKMMVNFLKGVFNENITSTLKITEKTSQEDFKQAFKDLFNLTENLNIKPHIKNVVNSIYPKGSVYVNGTKEISPINPFKNYNWNKLNLGDYKYAYLAINNTRTSLLSITGETKFEYYINISHSHKLQNPIEDEERTFTYPTLNSKLSLTYKTYLGNPSPSFLTHYATGGDDKQEITYSTSTIDYNVNYDDLGKTGKNTPLSTQTDDYKVTYTENLKHINCYVVYLS